MPIGDLIIEGQADRLPKRQRRELARIDGELVVRHREGDRCVPDSGGHGHGLARRLVHAQDIQMVDVGGVGQQVDHDRRSAFQHRSRVDRPADHRGIVRADDRKGRGRWHRYMAVGDGVVPHHRPDLALTQGLEGRVGGVERVARGGQADTVRQRAGDHRQHVGGIHVGGLQQRVEGDRRGVLQGRESLRPGHDRCVVGAGHVEHRGNRRRGDPVGDPVADGHLLNLARRQMLIHGIGGVEGEGVRGRVIGHAGRQNPRHTHHGQGGERIGVRHARQSIQGRDRAVFQHHGGRRGREHGRRIAVDGGGGAEQEALPEPVARGGSGHREAQGHVQIGGLCEVAEIEHAAGEERGGIGGRREGLADDRHAFDRSGEGQGREARAEDLIAGQTDNKVTRQTVGVQHELLGTGHRLWAEGAGQGKPALGAETEDGCLWVHRTENRRDCRVRRQSHQRRRDRGVRQPAGVGIDAVGVAVQHRRVAGEVGGADGGHRTRAGGAGAGRHAGNQTGA